MKKETYWKTLKNSRADYNAGRMAFQNHISQVWRRGQRAKESVESFFENILPQVGGTVLGAVVGGFLGEAIHLGVDTLTSPSQTLVNAAEFGLPILAGAGFGYVNGLTSTRFAQDAREWRQMRNFLNQQ